MLLRKQYLTDDKNYLRDNIRLGCKCFAGDTHCGLFCNSFRKNEKQFFLTKTTLSAFSPFIMEWQDLNPQSQDQSLTAPHLVAKLTKLECLALEKLLLPSLMLSRKQFLTHDNNYLCDNVRLGCKCFAGDKCCGLFCSSFRKNEKKFFNKDNSFSFFSVYHGVVGFEPTISGPVIDCSAPCGKVNKARVFGRGKAFTTKSNVITKSSF